MAKILIVDDEQRMRHLLSIILKKKGYEVEEAEDGMQAMDMLSSRPFDLVITDVKMPRMDGHALLRQIKKTGLNYPVVFISAFGTVESAVEAMRDGVMDFITKPFEQERVVLTVERILGMSRIIEENRELKKALNKFAAPDEIIHKSEAMQRTLDMAAHVANEESTVLIRGESGTGKELLAKYIHQAGPRAAGPFVPVNCAAIPQGLIESELFGHEKGSFTSASSKNVGKFEFSSGGTLFLDEIGDMPIEAQAKLLRVLQEKKIQRVGGRKEIDVDSRIVCATNQSLEELVTEGRFRSDLFYRINVFPIELPPLRERGQDVPILTRHFTQKFGGGQKINVTSGAMSLLSKYSWPGNVRELANVLERACILARKDGIIDEGMLSFLKIAPVNKNEFDFRLPPQGIDLEELELDMVEQAMEATNENQSAAARLLGLTRAKFRVLLKQYNEKRG
ncbi:sigma-54-dependent transcriptional regulator [Desulfonatronovibrio magnus]|uniref:sigma-54-dependent transcriptional regulator n=1 Tax=Desulfonatronovibrio magnus TaxID=698827 RepID=UPI0005EBEA6E|nr:sigma-54 dependent transcriptional regulator [Desulfonatronovibrio magnus]